VRQLATALGRRTREDKDDEEDEEEEQEDEEEEESLDRSESVSASNPLKRRLRTGNQN